MGQTLSNGVYLPNEGERNCYAGLASNWQILNTAVGNIAEKAPLVHTHGNITNDGKVGTTANLPLITGTGGAVQAGSFGNSANTFCEGNDSRLSDARTPVAHTHTKSDVTDLLNSNFIPSANNSYDLGSSSYQWNNLYAKNYYYYNGTAWGLDQNNTWTGINTFTSRTLFHVTEDPTYVLKSSTMQEGVIPSGERTAYAGYWQDKNANSLGHGRFVFYSTGVQAYEVYLRNKATNGSFSPSGSQIQSGFQLALHSDGNSELKIYAHTLPNGNGTWNLGDSTHKWKSLNGVNPGGLSLPDYSKASNIDTTNWNTNGTLTSYTPIMNGWLQITLPDDADNNGKYTNKIIILDSTAPNPITGQASATVGDIRIYLTHPVIANRTYSLYIKSYSNTITAARFIPCQGNA